MVTVNNDYDMNNNIYFGVRCVPMQKGRKLCDRDQNGNATLSLLVVLCCVVATATTRAQRVESRYFPLQYR
jgi:hypothetical protein